MTLSFEDQLREDLRAAVGDASFDASGGLEPASVIRLGQRAVQRRRLGYAASLAALAVVAVIAGQALGSSDPRRAETPPAVSTTVQPGKSVTATLTVGDDRYRVTLGTDSHVTIQRFDTVAGWVTTPLGMTARPTEPSSYSNQVDGTVIVVLPATVVRASPVYTDRYEKGWDTSASEDLGATGYRAQAYRLRGQLAALTFEGFVWQDRGGAVHGPAGGVLPAASFQAPGTPDDGVALVWWDRANGVFGAGIDGQASVSNHQDELQVSAYINDESTSFGNVFGIAPANSSNLRAEFTAGTRFTIPLTTKPLGDTGRVAFYGSVEGPAGKVRLVRMTWQDDKGFDYSKDYVETP